MGRDASVAGTGSRPPARVLTIVDSLSVGGVQTHLLALCREINRTEYRTDVFSLVRMLDFFSGPIAESGSRVIFGGERPIHLPQVMWRLARTIRQGNYSIIQTYLPASFLIGTLVAGALGKRKLVTTICARAEQIHGRILAFRNYRRLEFATKRYLTPFPSQLAALGIPAHKIRTCRFATSYQLEEHVARREDNPIVARYGLDDAYPILLSVGRLHVDKGHEHAIRALHALREGFPRARLLVLGEGRDEARLRELAGPESRGVTFCGVHEKLAPFYSLADVYINPAINEGLNLSQLAAMAHGVPTVAFETGFTEYEQPGRESAMERVPVADATALARTIAALLADPGRRSALRENGTRFAAKYDQASVARDYLEVYRELDP